MADTATDAPQGANFTPVNVVVLKAGRIRFQGMVDGKLQHLRVRLAQGRVIQLPTYLVDTMLKEADPKIRPAAADEVVSDPQFTLPGYPDSPGYQATDTSKAAADAIGKSGRSRWLAKRVLEVITAQGDFGATAEEIAAIVKEPRGSIQPRTTELKEKGKIRDSERRRTNRSSNRAAIVWVATAAGAETADKPRRLERADLVAILEQVSPILDVVRHMRAVTDKGLGQDAIKAAGNLHARVERALKHEGVL